MLRKLATACLILVLMLVTVSLAQPAQAQPPALPHQFYGSVTIGGNPAPAGTSIVAQISGVTYASTSVDSQGKYGYSPILLIPADSAATPTKEGGANGDTVRFFVGGTAAQTFTYASGGITRLDLEISSGGGGGTPPSAPALSSPADSATGLSAMPDLQWNTSSGATSYQAQVSTANNFSSTVFNQAGIATTHVTVSPALTDSTTYYWRVNASNSAGNSSWSSVHSFTTAAASTTPPSAPALSSPANGATGISTTVTLQWNPSSGATSYQAQVSTASNFGVTVFNQAGISTTQVTVSPALTAGNTYYCRVNATNSAGTSDWSAVSNFTTASSSGSSGSSGTGESGGSSGGISGGSQGGSQSSETSVSASILGQVGTFSLNSAGLLSSQATLKSADGKVQLSIKSNTAVSLQGQSLTVTAEAMPPAAPSNAMLINAYNLLPNGTTFNPPITLMLKYNAASLPQGVNESNLYVAFWTGNNWSPLVSTVDTQNKIVTADVGHFTTFALLGEVTQTTSPAASFTVSSLNINPAVVKPGEEANVSASVTNIGGVEGSYRAVLSINGINEAEKVINLAPQKSQTVAFTVTKGMVGQYEIVIGNQRAGLTVSQTPAPAGKSGLSMTVIIALAAGVLLIIILIIAIARKQRG